MALELPGGFQWPTGFIWGAATAAAQVEGAAHEDGKLDSIWDHFARIPGNVAHGDTPEVAVDHYHRMPQDVQLMTRLGLDSYRFSVSWARVKPADGPVNPKGLDFYSRLVDELLENGILPWLTLYHWDLPQAVEETGGWANRDTAHRFLDYAIAVHEALGDRVTHWTTFNEPLCSSLIAYAGGEHAPGRQEPRAGLAALHHQHLAHGLAVRELRLRGAWFFQARRDREGRPRLLEVAPRIAGSMALSRARGINYALLSVYAHLGRPFSVLPLDHPLQLDRALGNRYRTSLDYRRVYLDLDDTLVRDGAVNPLLAALLYQWQARGVEVVLLTRHAGCPHRTLERHHLSAGLFAQVVHLQDGSPKSRAIAPGEPAILIDDSFRERREVREATGIPVFDLDAVEQLLDTRG